MAGVLSKRWFRIAFAFAVINVVGLAKIAAVVRNGKEARPVPRRVGPVVPPHERARPFLIESVTPYSGDGPYGRLRVNSTGQANPKGLADFIRIEPAVHFTVETYYYGFELNGRFEPGAAYRVKFLKGLRSVKGEKLKRDVVRRAVIPDRPRSLRFKTRGIYLAAGGNQLLDAESVNIETIEALVDEVYRNNLIHYARSRPGRRSADSLARRVATRRIELDAPKNKVARWQIDLRALLGEQGYGAYMLTARDADRGWPTRRQLVLLSDLGVTVKKSASDMLVWVNTLSSAAPLADCAVSVYSRKNQEVLSGKTDAEGLLHFRDVDWAGERRPFALLASKGRDVALIDIERCALNRSPFDVGGRSYLREGYEAFVYGDTATGASTDRARPCASTASSARPAPPCPPRSPCGSGSRGPTAARSRRCPRPCRSGAALTWTRRFPPTR